MSYLFIEKFGGCQFSIKNCRVLGIVKKENKL